VKRRLPFILFIVFAALLVVGLLWGEYKTVLEKAVTVCLDCIGIG
jgi:hypothetical protein